MRIGRRTWLGAMSAAVAGGLVVAGSAHAAAAGLTFEVYEDTKGEHRWRLKSANGQVIASSGQGYKAKADCRRAIEIIREGAASAKVEEASAEKAKKT